MAELVSLSTHSPSDENLKMTRQTLLRLLVVCALAAGLATPAAAQNWSGDARHIAMGGVGTGENLASKSVEQTDDYRSIVIPLGLFQVFKNMDVFDPDSDEFSLVRILEYAASPLHYTFDRDQSTDGPDFFNDIRNAVLVRDLNVYRGYVPVTQPVGYGLANPVFGLTIPVYKSDRVRHGIFVGAGPYMAMRGAMTVDDQLSEILSSETNIYIPSAQMPITADTRAEVALAITGGYRGHYGWPMGVGSGDEREGLYVALNYSYLRGFWMEDATTAVRLDTCPVAGSPACGAGTDGLLTVNPSLPFPAALVRRHSSEGRGQAIDLGVAAVINKWELGFGINGIANEIEWKDVEATSFTLNDLFNGSDFFESVTVPIDDLTFSQPVEYTGNVGYRTGAWTFVGQVSKRTTDYAPDEDRLNDLTFRTGAEYRFLIFEPRGGAYYTRDRWQPAGGVGLNFGKFGIDAAIYSTDTNAERERKATFALSLRIGAKRPI